MNATAAKSPSLAVLVAISTLQPIALNLLAPATPALARHFATSYATIQLTLTLYLTAVALTQFVVGPLSDRYGRRPCVLVGIAVFVLGSALGAMAESSAVLLVARGLEGAGAGTAFALARAIIRDTASRDEAASRIATVTMVMVVAPMLAPYLGGQIETALGWRAIFWFMLGAGVVVMLMSLVGLNETAPRVGVATSLLAVFRALPALGRDREFLTSTVILAMTSGAFFSFIAAAPYVVVEHMGRGSDVYGAYFVLNALGYMAGNFTMSRRAGRIGSARLVEIGLVISLAGLTIALAFSLSPHWTPLTLFLPLGVCAFGNGLTIPGATAAALSARPELAGSAAGLMGAVQLGSGALATIAVSSLVVLWAPALTAAMWAMIVVAIFALYFRRFTRS